MTRLVEVFRHAFPCRASAVLVATAARQLGLDVEERPAGELGVLVVASGLHTDRAAGERLVLLAMGEG